MTDAKTTAARITAAMGYSRAKNRPRGNPPIPDPNQLHDLQLAAIADSCRPSILPFTRLFWPVVEPERKFVEGWHLGCIAEHLKEVSTPSGCIKNLIVNVPPRCSKSLLVCVFWFAWAWTQWPATRWLYSSFAGDLVGRDSKRCRDIIRHPLYQRLWGVQIKRDQDTQVRFTNTYEGFRYAVTVGGQGMGEGADFIVCDDPINPKKARSAVERANCIYWWRTTMARRVTDERTARRVIIMQRLHEADLTGYLIAEQFGWDHLVIPMRWESRRYFLPETATPSGPVKGGDGARLEVPSLAIETAAAPSPETAADPDTFARAIEALRLMGGQTVEATPRDAIKPTALQLTRPELIDGPTGSGRSEDGQLLWPERFPEPEVAKAEQEYAHDAAGQYQQRPSGESGDIFRREYFRRWEPLWEAVTDAESGEVRMVFGGVNLFGPDPDAPPRPFRANQLTWYQTIDTALTEGKRSSYTAVCTAFATPEFDLGVWHMFRGRLEVQYQFGLLAAMRDGPVLWSQKSHAVTPLGKWPFPMAFQAVERKASGIGLIQEGARRGHPFHPLEVEGDKVQRAVPVATMYVNGKVYHPPPSRPWVVDMEDELTLFPNGTYKDQADVIAYAGHLITHDAILRQLCTNRVMADPGESAEELAAKAAIDAGVVTVPTPHGPIVVDFGDDSDFGDIASRWRR